MKKIINCLIYLPFAFLLCTACESWLDVEPSDQFSATSFWRTEEHAKAGLTGCYNALGPWRNMNNFMEFDLITSNSMPYNEANGTHAIGRGTHLPITPLIVNLWGNCYAGIGRTNTFLDNVSRCNMPDGTRNRFIAEAKFLRAFFYFNLVDKFGGVPLIVETPDADKHASLPRATKEAVVEQIIKDLTEAAATPELPLSYTGADRGRATKGAALALKARVLLYNQRWEESAKAAKDVMDLGVYQLFPDYRNFYREANKHNVEVIFNVESAEPDFTQDFDNTIFRLNRPAPLKELVDKYQWKDGKYLEDSEYYNPERPYDDRDPRLHYTITVIGYPYNGRLITAADVVTTGYGVKKYTTYPDDQTIAHPARSAFNPIYIRYAEVLLTYAEAQNEFLTAPDQSVYDAINAVRQREGVDMPKIPEGLDKNAMREAVRLERRIELAFEGIYYSDILRWRTAEIENNGVMHRADGTPAVERSFNPNRDYLWPIPHNQRVQNPNLTTNPGWEGVDVEE